MYSLKTVSSLNIFLQNMCPSVDVFKPVLVRLNYGGAFFFTFLTSAMLHVRSDLLIIIIVSIIRDLISN